MNRDEKVNHLITLIEYVEGAVVPVEYFKSHVEEKIDEEIEFYEYVSMK